MEILVLFLPEIACQTPVPRKDALSTNMQYQGKVMLHLNRNDRDNAGCSFLRQIAHRHNKYKFKFFYPDAALFHPID